MRTKNFLKTARWFLALTPETAEPREALRLWFINTTDEPVTVTVRSAVLLDERRGLQAVLVGEPAEEDEPQPLAGWSAVGDVAARSAHPLMDNLAERSGLDVLWTADITSATSTRCPKRVEALVEIGLYNRVPEPLPVLELEGYAFRLARPSGGLHRPLDRPAQRGDRFSEWDGDMWRFLEGQARDALYSEAWMRAYKTLVNGIPGCWDATKLVAYVHRGVMILRPADTGSYATGEEPEFTRVVTAAVIDAIDTFEADSARRLPDVVKG